MTEGFIVECGFNMKTTFDTDDILFQILFSNAELRVMLSGGVYKGDRSDDSQKEDIVVNTITVTREYPQLGASNVNIYAPDLSVKIEGKPQRKADVERLRTLTNKVLSVLSESSIQGLMFWVTNQSVIKEPDVYQHFSNLRIEWNIHK